MNCDFNVIKTKKNNYLNVQFQKGTKSLGVPFRLYQYEILLLSACTYAYANTSCNLEDAIELLSVPLLGWGLSQGLAQGRMLEKLLTCMIHFD